MTFGLKYIWKRERAYASANDAGEKSSISLLPSNAPFFNNWGGPDDQRASMNSATGQFHQEVVANFVFGHIPLAHLTKRRVLTNHSVSSHM